jgi:hypothetical protein
MSSIPYSYDNQLLKSLGPKAKTIKRKKHGPGRGQAQKVVDIN